ncbi:MAG: thiamine pyrophosphate-dependent enzyme [Sphingomonas sp.]
MPASSRTAARALVDTLVAQGVAAVFCVPGESYLAVLDALADTPAIRVVTCRHEAGAAHMAAAHGRLTGRPGICMVTRGPGATHASVGIHAAAQDSAPMILFVGQIARGHRGRGAFQEVDYPATLGGLAKWAVELDDPARVDEIVSRAFSVAINGRPGPVIVALPEDMLAEPAPGLPPAPRAVLHATALAPALAAEIVARIDAAARPLLLLGGGGWSDAALLALADWAEAGRLPVALAFRRKDLIDNAHPGYVGDLGLGANPKLLAHVREADLIVAIGARLGDAATQGYTLFTRAETAARLIHLHPDPAELGRVWPPSLAAAVAPDDAAAALVARPLGLRDPAWRDSGHADYRAFAAPVPVTGAVNLSEIFAEFSAALPADAIITNGAGNYAAWAHRFHRHRRPRTQLGPASGTMGYGLPAAIAAKLLWPERDVIALAGDGCFLMTAQELATAVQYDARVIVVVVDNGAYGTIRMHQARDFPGRPIATDLRNPDFAAYARAFGCWAETVETTAGFAPALSAARGSGRPALIHLKTALADIAPGRVLDDGPG